MIDSSIRGPCFFFLYFISFTLYYHSFFSFHYVHFFPLHFYTYILFRHFTIFLFKHLIPIRLNTPMWRIQKTSPSACSLSIANLFGFAEKLKKRPREQERRLLIGGGDTVGWLEPICRQSQPLAWKSG